METCHARDSRSQFALHHGGSFDRWRSDRETISAGAVQGSQNLEIFGERKGRTQRRIERVVSPRRGEHRTCRACRWPAIDEARGLSDGAREESAERFAGGRKI